MIVVLSGTDRVGSNSGKVARLAIKFLKNQSVDTSLIDLEKLPNKFYQPKHYKEPPNSFKKYQEMILDCNGLLTIVPEYNGSYPGVLKYFIDILRFPESLRGIPTGFIGLSAGSFGGIRAVEHLEMIFQAREAHLFGLRSLFVHVDHKINKAGTEITDEFTKKSFETMLSKYIDFVYKLRPLN